MSAIRSVLVTAFAPASTGNGSAMRAGMWRRALGRVGPVDVVMLPVAGMAAPAGVIAVELPGPADVARGAVELAADPFWRSLLARVDPLPRVAQAAPAWLGRRVVARLGGRPDVVVSFKAGVGLVALDLARAVGAPLVVDLDDDQVALATAWGHPEGAATDRRLRTALSASAAAVVAAAPAEAAAIAVDLGRPVGVVPNTVDLVPSTPLPVGGSVLFVGNLTYPPNADGMRWFATEVLPRLPEAVSVTVVGAGGAEALAGVIDRRLAVVGMVPDLAPWYRAASVVVCPLRHGAGTRLKVLEALAWGRPVVSTTVGAAGLDLVGGRDLVLADDPADFAAEVGALIADPVRSADLGAAGRARVGEVHSPRVAEAAVASLLGTVREEWGSDE